VTTPSSTSAWYEEHANKAAAALAAVSGANLAKNLHFAIFDLPAVTYIGLMLSHSAHHRGQLSAYLRPMGAKVPRIYGGSADEPIEIPAAT
jgi:DinB family protein